MSPLAPDRSEESAEAGIERPDAGVETSAELTAAERAAEVLPEISGRVQDAEARAAARVAEAARDMGLPQEDVAGAREAVNLDSALGEVHEEMERAAEDAVAGVEAAAGGPESQALSPETLKGWRESEQRYLGTNKDSANLQGRYEDERVSADYVLGQISEFARSREVPAAPDLKGRKFDAEAKEAIALHLESVVAAFFLNPEKGSHNPAKHESVFAETLRYVDLVAEAQAEGDLPRDLAATAVLDMARENVSALALQDRAASENLLGDHGVRHLVDHNIRMSENIMDQIQAHGQEVRAVDRLVLHQVMIDHDLGYAMDPVREGINAGKFGVDTGHNLLAARFIRERSAAEAPDPMREIFSEEQLGRIHKGILDHDSSSVEFSLDNSDGARDRNIESAIHLADNTHAFEDKLPEVLYGVPESLETMRLLKIAGEAGDDAAAAALKERLVRQIEASEEFSADDKEALSRAARSIQPASYKFAVPRICGNKPEFTVEGDGGVIVSVQESAIHREVTGLFSQKELAQFQKFVKDLGGPKELDPDAEEIRAGAVTVRLVRPQEGTEASDYQERLNQLVENPKFRRLVETDNELSARQNVVEGALARGDAKEMSALAAGLGAEADLQAAESLRLAVEDIKVQRRRALEAYTQESS